MLWIDYLLYIICEVFKEKVPELELLEPSSTLLKA